MKWAAQGSKGQGTLQGKQGKSKALVQKVVQFPRVTCLIRLCFV